jgi:hypothetical protein
MPKPVYIICSEGGADDRATGALSHFNVLEEVRVARIQTPASGQPAGGQPIPRVVPVRMTAVWMQDQGDPPDQAYDFEVAIRQPAEPELVVSSGQFTFATSFHRLIAPMYFAGFSALGVLEVECRIRARGQESWQSRQCYPILLQEGPAALAAAGATPAVDQGTGARPAGTAG